MYIAFEGIDGSGKTVAIKKAAELLTSLNIPHITIKEPGETLLGKKLRRMLFDHTDLSNEVKMLLIQVDRIQTHQTLIQPALEEGVVVLADRSAYSTIAYQIGGAQVPKKMVKTILKHSSICWPDHVLFFDCPLDVGLARAANKNIVDDEFYQKIYDTYQDLRKKKNWCTIDTTNFDRVDGRVNYEILTLIGKYLNDN